MDVQRFLSGGQADAVIDLELDRGIDLGEAPTSQVVDELDELCAAANRIQARIFEALIRCDLRRVWIPDDCRDLAHWVGLRYGISSWKARRWVACAWALPRYPAFRDAFEQGLLSTDKLVELTRLAGVVDEPEAKLLKWATRVASATIRERADQAKRIAAEEIAEVARARSVTWWWEDDHSYLNLYGRLPADMGIRVTSALDRLARKLPVSPEDYGADLQYEDDYEATLEARRADALDLLAGQAIAEDADADRATVMVHVGLSTLVSGEGNGIGPSGEILSPEVSSRLCCDSRLQTVLHGDDGAVVGIGHTSRAIPRWLRRQIEHRDGFRCTFPGCGSRLGLDAHHVVPWPLGPTEPHNLTCLCRFHHRLVHDFHWHVTMGADQKTRWFRPDWTPYVPRPPSPLPADDERAEPISLSTDAYALEPCS